MNDKIPEQEQIVTSDAVPVVVPPPVPSFQQYIAKSSFQEQIEKTRFECLKKFFIECKRVLRVTKKSDREEFKTIVKISGLGMLVIGVIGFLVHVIKELLF